MTDLSELLNRKKDTGGRPCLLRKFIADLKPEDRAAVEGALYNPDVSAMHIWTVLREHLGAEFSHSVIIHHRARKCMSCLKNS